MVWRSGMKKKKAYRGIRMRVASPRQSGVAARNQASASSAARQHQAYVSGSIMVANNIVSSAAHISSMSGASISENIRGIAKQRRHSNAAAYRQ